MDGAAAGRHRRAGARSPQDEVEAAFAGVDELEDFSELEPDELEPDELEPDEPDSEDPDEPELDELDFVLPDLSLPDRESLR
ncbi:hypothetical protein [Ruania alkalisoli]|uniref:hypothetical protein n=1 Tax=Ruania alkalisoli TaxID=2779775 RepID=UPI0031B621A6